MKSTREHLAKIVELEAKNSQLTIDLTHEVGHRCAAEAKLADWENSMKHALDPCPDEKHCACVPFLRKRINELEAELSALREVTAEYWQTLRHYDHDDISTPFERFADGPMPSRDERYHQLCEDRNDAIQDKGWAELKLARGQSHLNRLDTILEGIIERSAGDFLGDIIDASHQLGLAHKILSEYGKEGEK